MKTFSKRILLLLALCCALPLSACSGNHTLDFITLSSTDGSQNFKLGMSRDAIYSVMGTTSADKQSAAATYPELNAGVKLKWPNNTDFTKCIAMIDTGRSYKTIAGISLDSTKADISSAYAKDSEIETISSDDSKLVLGKQIDGVNYAIAFRFYSDGTLQAITVYNADLYTDSDDSTEYK